MNDKRPIIFEDGQQMRDFVSVYDVARACRLALEVEAARDMIFNVGSGESVTIKTSRCVSPKSWARASNRRSLASTGWEISGTVSRILAARRNLGYQAKMTLEEGMRDLAAWLDLQTAHDNFNEMRHQLASRGLLDSRSAMRFALVNPAWSFDGSIYFGCREPHLPLELNYSKALLEEAGHEAGIDRWPDRGTYFRTDIQPG